MMTYVSISSAVDKVRGLGSGVGSNLQVGTGGHNAGAKRRPKIF